MSMNPLTHQSRQAETHRDSSGQSLTPEGTLYLWCPSAPALEKTRGVLERFGAQYEIEDGGCIVARMDWPTMRAMVMPLRRGLTHAESESVRVLYKADSGDLTTADFPKVKSYAQFAQVAESNWLHELLDEERYTSVLQKIVHCDAPTRVFAREALLRGIARDESVIHPIYLFDAARGCGMLNRLEIAARKAAVNRMVIDGISENLFINVTPSAVEDPMSSLGETIAFIDEAGIPHERIVFEIIESDQAHDLSALQRLLGTHRDAGFRVALDDVGAGYSGLNLLHQLRPDFIKLDMELIHGVTTDSYKALITTKTLEIARALGIESIAEGVETDDELAWVRDNGATYAQGYGIARPTLPFLHGRTPPGLL